MAEILISLTIIGVIAAITLPALQANINESAWRTQRKALYSRMSQAISMLPSLNGYGEYAGSWSADSVTVTNDTAAQAFVTEGLNTVLQINNICAIPLGTTDTTTRHKELAKCGMPDDFTNMANSKIPFPTKLSELNPMFTSTKIANDGTSHHNPQNNIDTNVAAFETKNGESVAVFYNPLCQFYMGETTWHYSQPKMCANFIYDLNGRKGPNKVGKDIGVITALYPVDGEIVAPMPLEKNMSSRIHTLAAAACKAKDKDSRLPNRDELSAIFYNKVLLGIPPGGIWSSSISSADSSKAWAQSFNTGYRYVADRINSPHQVRCVKR